MFIWNGREVVKGRKPISIIYLNSLMRRSTIAKDASRLDLYGPNHNHSLERRQSTIDRVLPYPYTQLTIVVLLDLKLLRNVYVVMLPITPVQSVQNILMLTLQSDTKCYRMLMCVSDVFLLNILQTNVTTNVATVMVFIM